MKIYKLVNLWPRIGELTVEGEERTAPKRGEEIKVIDSEGGEIRLVVNSASHSAGGREIRISTNQIALLGGSPNL